MERKLKRSNKDKMLGGVCGGLGEYLNIDPTIVRLIFIILALAGGPGILIYIILWLIMPLDDGIIDIRPKGTENNTEHPTEN
jgi:phage shock protein C